LPLVDLGQWHANGTVELAATIGDKVIHGRYRGHEVGTGRLRSSMAGTAAGRQCAGDLAAVRPYDATGESGMLVVVGDGTSMAALRRLSGQLTVRLTRRFMLSYPIVMTQNEATEG
jgi:hypothetical protein